MRLTSKFLFLLSILASLVAMLLSRCFSDFFNHLIFHYGSYLEYIFYFSIVFIMLMVSLSVGEKCLPEAMLKKKLKEL